MIRLLGCSQRFCRLVLSLKGFMVGLCKLHTLEIEFPRIETSICRISIRILCLVMGLILKKNRPLVLTAFLYLPLTAFIYLSFYKLSSFGIVQPFRLTRMRLSLLWLACSSCNRVSASNVAQPLSKDYKAHLSSQWY